MPEDQTDSVIMRTAVLQQILDDGVRLDKLRAVGVERPPDAGRLQEEFRRPAEAIPQVPRACVGLTGLGGRKALHRNENRASGRLYFQLHAIARADRSGSSATVPSALSSNIAASVSAERATACSEALR